MRIRNEATAQERLTTVIIERRLLAAIAESAFESKVVNFMVPLLKSQSFNGSHPGGPPRRWKSSEYPNSAQQSYKAQNQIRIDWKS
jgi:hypothetical protein